MAENETFLPWVRVVGGHTRIASGARVQLGAVCQVEIDHTLDGAHPETIAEWFNENKRFFGDEQVQQLAEDFASGYLARGVLGALGFVMAEGNYQQYQNAKDLILEASSPEQASFIKALQTLSNRSLRLTAKIEVHGTSMIPTVAAVFARIVQLHFDNGTSVNLVDLPELVAADSTGDTRGVRADKRSE